MAQHSVAQFSAVGIVGTGTMGSAVAAALTRNDIAVTIVDHGEDLAVLAGCDLVIEAVTEDADAKSEVFAALDQVISEECVLATHTAALSVTSLAVQTRHPKRVVGAVFANPATGTDLVQVVPTPASDDNVVRRVESFFADLELDHITVGDRTGQIINALLLPYLNQAAGMFEAKYATRDDIDAGMRFGCGLPMGPLAMLDHVGLDTAYDALTAMHSQTGDRRHAPAPILKHLVSAGMTGVKSGRGFYTYTGPGSGEIVADRQQTATDAEVPTSDITTVGVVGTGTMATGIVEVFAKAGCAVVYVGRSQDKVDAVAAAITKSMEKAISRGKASEDDKSAVLGRLTGATSRDALEEVDLVVEAIAEDLQVKQELFRDLDRICKDGAILATTTSSLPVVECAAVTQRPQDVVGMHFFNPAPIMKLVEVVSTVQTAPHVTATCVDLAKRLRKVPVQCGDRAGFIVNALLFPYLNDAVIMLEEHYATVQTIDHAITTGVGYPMGPFALLDVVGLDVSLTIQQQLLAEFAEPGFRPADLLVFMVNSGYLGRKSGRGFRTYA